MQTGGAGGRGATRLVYGKRILARDRARRNLVDFHSCSSVPEHQS